MAVNDETLRLAQELRIVIGAEVDQATRDLVAAWAKAWQTLSVEWSQAYLPILNR